jgi:RND family efflux transporter MFP subunit
MNPKSSKPASRFRSKGHFWFNVIFGGVLPIVVLVASAYAGWRLIETSPQVDRKGGGPRDALLVETMVVESATQKVSIEAMGTVQAARRVNLRPQVAGPVIEVNAEYIPGGQFAAGETILKLDPRDYDLAIRQRQADVAKAESQLKLEQGRQSIARQEFELLGQGGGDSNTDLMLRAPQLEEVQADLDAVRTRLESARLDLERTVIRAPFNAVVLERGTELGMQAGPATDLATLADTDRYWVVLAVPVEDLRYIDVPLTPGETGSPVTIHGGRAWRPGQTRTGRVLRLGGQLNEEIRTAEVFVAVDDPLALRDENADQPPLLLNAYVSAEIEGREYPGVFTVPRRYLRNGDNVWILNREGTLETRPVDVIHRGREHVLVGGGLSDGEQVVMTNLSAAVDGMALRTERSGEGTIEMPDPAEPLSVGESVADDPKTDRQETETR